MPYLNVNGARIFYEEHGSGAETIVFSHGLLMNSDMFREQIDTLKGKYRCIAYDHRGQGRSEVTPGGYDMDTVAGDAAELIRELNAARCHFVGLSMGGFVGMRLAIHHPEMLRSLVLMETSADPEPNVKPYRMLAFIGRWFGFRIVAPRVMKIMFGKTFLNDPVRAQEREEWQRRIVNNNRTGTTRAAHGVIDREGVFDQLDQIQTPTLVMVGEEDVATTPEKARRIHEKIPGSELATIPQAGHSSSIEQAEAVSKWIEEFISRRG